MRQVDAEAYATAKVIGGARRAFWTFFRLYKLFGDIISRAPLCNELGERPVKALAWAERPERRSRRFTTSRLVEPLRRKSNGRRRETPRSAFTALQDYFAVFGGSAEPGRSDTGPREAGCAGIA
jgi:hypothetical protein